METYTTIAQIVIESESKNGAIEYRYIDINIFLSGTA